MEKEIDIKKLEELMEEMANTSKESLQPWPTYSTYAGEKAFVLTKEEHELLDDIFFGNVGLFPKAIDLAKKLKLSKFLELYEKEI